MLISNVVSRQDADFQQCLETLDKICYTYVYSYGQYYRRLPDLTSTDSSKSLSLNWLSYRLLQPYSLKVTVGVTEQW